MGVQKDPKFSDHLTLEKYVIQATKKLTVGRRNNQNGSLAVLQGTWVYVHFFPVSTDIHFYKNCITRAVTTHIGASLGNPLK